MSESDEEMQNVGDTPMWSVATVLTIFVSVSYIAQRLIHRLGHWLDQHDKKPLLEAVEKMKEELMLLGFISLFLTASSGLIANLCIPSEYYNDSFIPCSKAEIEEMEEMEESTYKERKLLGVVLHLSYGRVLEEWKSECKEGYEPFLSYEGLEQLHRFIFVMAVTHIFYCCLTMLLAIMKIRSWREWEDEAHKDDHDSLPGFNIQQRRSTSVKFHNPNPFVKNDFFILLACFFRQFGRSVKRHDYLTLRKGFIANHCLASNYDFHRCMIRSTEEEFQMIVGLSAPLWAFCVAFMLFNVKGSHLYFWVAITPLTLVLVVGTKLQYIIATLVLENARITGIYSETKLTPRDDLFWFKKPELLLSLIQFILFQNAFEMASFVWFWWQFGYNSCFIGNHVMVYMRLVIGYPIIIAIVDLISARLAGQFLCSYSTVPLYALVTRMGTNYRKDVILRRLRLSMHGSGKAARKRRRGGFHGADFTTMRTSSVGDFSTLRSRTSSVGDFSTLHSRTSSVVSIEDDHQFAEDTSTFSEIQLQPSTSLHRND